MMNPNADDTTMARQSVEQLHSLFRDELAATETYEAALHHDVLARFVEPLDSQRRAHAARAATLALRLTQLGAGVPASSGAWGTWVRVITEAAASLSPEITLSVILEEEESLVRDYQSALGRIDQASGAVVTGELLPAQIVTHDAMSKLHAEAGR